jgi:hypothetical protein
MSRSQSMPLPTPPEIKAMNKKQLGVAYTDLIGHNPFDEKPAPRIAAVRTTLIDYIVERLAEEQLPDCPPPVDLRLVGLDGNAFMILGKFIQQARREGWSKEQIDRVTDEAKSSDYAHLLDTISSHCEHGGF